MSFHCDTLYVWLSVVGQGNKSLEVRMLEFSILFASVLASNNLNLNIYLFFLLVVGLSFYAFFSFSHG